MVVAFAGLVVVSMLTAAFAEAQDARVEPTGESRFDVASVKRNTSNDMSQGIELPPGRLILTNMPLRYILFHALDTPFSRIIGMPQWADERFDINATLPVDGSQGAWRTMLKNLLVERFSLMVHVEARPGDAYLLRRLRPGGPLGRGLRASLVDCASLERQGPAASREPSATTAADSTCGVRTNGSVGGDAYLRARGVSLSTLGQVLSLQSGMAVIDRTGLSGSFDIELEYDVRSLRPISSISGASERSSSSPSIFSAVREQLGLRLDVTTAPVEHVVIDKIEGPIPD